MHVWHYGPDAYRVTFNHEVTLDEYLEEPNFRFIKPGGGYETGELIGQPDNFTIELDVLQQTFVRWYIVDQLVNVSPWYTPFRAPLGGPFPYEKDWD